jgi:hypothetical protein
VYLHSASTGERVYACAERMLSACALFVGTFPELSVYLHSVSCVEGFVFLHVPLELSVCCLHMPQELTVYLHSVSCVKSCACLHVPQELSVYLHSVSCVESAYASRAEHASSFNLACQELGLYLHMP